MIEKLVETKTPSAYSDKVFNYSYHYEKTEFENIDDLIKFHSDCEEYAIAYSGLSEHVSYHFPAHTKGRTIYRTECKEKMGVGIYTARIKK